MPIFEDGNLDHKEQSMQAPLTPPQEPERNGLAISGVVAQLEDVALSRHYLVTQERGQEVKRSDVSHTTTEDEHNGVLGAGDNTLASPQEGNNGSNTNYKTSSSIHTLTDSGAAKLRRTSSEAASTSKERYYEKRYNGDKLWEITKAHNPTSVVGLSPTDLEPNGEPIEGFSLYQPRLPIGETPVSQARSPSLSDASHRPSLDRSLQVEKRPRNLTIDVTQEKLTDNVASTNRPRVPRALSTPSSIKSPSGSISQESRRIRTTSKADQNKMRNISTPRQPPPSPLPTTIPIPPLSLSTYLQLELSSQRPSQVYIHRASAGDFPYESSRVKIERLLNFLFLPHQLEGVLWFGVLACLDVWLYTFTILPLRMIKSMFILSQSWANNVATESRFVADYVFTGSQRMYHRKRSKSNQINGVLSRTSSETRITQPANSRPRQRSTKHHRRVKSVPSMLLPDDKADILKGLLIIMTCLVLLRLDASRMYHLVRGQGAIKLYVVYNLLEVCDRLLSAIGQDVLECLFSREALERKPDGHSKVLRPAWLFLLALTYSVIHATALFYQVVTLNVAVNSYNNALITLLMSNQFVEIKGTVFKKFERENLFQLTCADIVERFQLWHMLMIIASRNIVETGGLSIGMPYLFSPATAATSSSSPNITLAAPPLTAASILPRSFMIVPSMLSSVSSYVPTISHVLGPFVIVLGSEMFIDWLKHAYINKFNNTRPVIYSRFLDILAKDYYTNAFGEQNLTKRLGLPVIPLSCLMIRAGFQTYQMFVASWVPAPSSSGTATLSSIHQQYSTTRAIPTSTAGMIVKKMDELLSQLPAVLSNPQVYSYFTTTLVILLMFLVLLVCKLVLGMGLLAFSRARYASMKEREHGNSSHYVEGGRRVGGWGIVEVDEDKRRVIYEDDPAGLQTLRTKEVKDKSRKESEKDNFGPLEKVARFEMVAKRIW